MDFTHKLSTADPKQQKQMLGERLFPLIQNFNFFRIEKKAKLVKNAGEI